MYEDATEHLLFVLKLTFSLFFSIGPKLWSMYTIWELHHKNKNSLENCIQQSFSYSRA